MLQDFFLFIYVPMILVTVVMVTDLAIVLDVSCQVRSDEFFDVAAAAADYLDPLCFKNIFGTLAHIAGEHDCNAHLSQDRRYSALASASLRRGHPAYIGNLSVDDIENRIIRTMAEVVIHASISCWYSYLHNVY